MENDDAVSQDKVLIERDGHFELVSTSDVQAEIMADLLTEEQPQGDHALSTSDTIVPENVKDPIKIDETPNDDDKEGIKTQAPLINTTYNPADTNDPPNNSTKVTIELLTVSTSALAMKRNISPLARRSISAPPGQQNRHLVKAEQERAALNEQAFQIWLEKKNSELAKKRELERLNKKEEESQEQKEERNRKAFEHWLAMKQRQMSAIRSATKDCNIDQEEKKVKRDEAFKIWLQRKSEEKQRLIELEKQRQKELAETAKTIDSKIAQAAYKE